MDAEQMIAICDAETFRICAVLSEAKRLPPYLVEEMKAKAYSVWQLRALYEADLFPNDC